MRPEIGLCTIGSSERGSLVFGNYLSERGSYFLGVLLLFCREASVTTYVSNLFGVKATGLPGFCADCFKFVLYLLLRNISSLSVTI
jgi:hypothetical protein